MREPPACSGAGDATSTRTSRTLSRELWKSPGPEPAEPGPVGRLRPPNALGQKLGEVRRQVGWRTEAMLPVYDRHYLPERGNSVDGLGL